MLLKNNRGFTLIETIATLCLTMIAIVMFSSLIYTYASTKKISSSNELLNFNLLINEKFKNNKPVSSFQNEDCLIANPNGVILFKLNEYIMVDNVKYEIEPIKFSIYNKTLLVYLQYHNQVSSILIDCL